MPWATLLRPAAHTHGGMPWDNQDVLREELFSIERLEQHAASLAVAQQITLTPVRRPPLSVRLSDNEAVLLSSYRAIAKAVGEGRAITPAAEWVLDNYHLVEAQIREIREDLPPGFYRQLPKLATGPFSGYPRVFGIAWAFVAHTDSHFDPEALRRFVRAYQSVQPLTIGELWAVAITLRIVLVENLRRSAFRIVNSRAARQEADDVTDRLLGLNGLTPNPDALTQTYDQDSALPNAFLVQLVQRLRGQDPKVTPALRWLEERLAKESTTAEAVVHDEHQRQGGSSVTVRNIITSMRLISELEWSEFFESVSLVDDTLRAGSDFAQMDFATRNLYRSAIEALARGSRLTELEIARAAVDAATHSANTSTRQRDPGYYLIAAGRRAFETRVAFKAPLRQAPGRWIMRHGAGPYISAILLVTASVLAVPLFSLHALHVSVWHLAVLGFFGLVAAVDIAVAFVNRAVTSGFGATSLPGLALREGVPPQFRTLLAVPTLLTSAAAVEEEIRRLEVHYLASPESNLHFALLTDWIDAATEHTATDEALLDIAARGIALLNARYAPLALSAGDRFVLFHRRRVWSEVQQKWMGWERKRGKLHELNRLLRGATDTCFVDIGGSPPRVPPNVRYVITLDADTRLPREAARRLIGKLAHPLNQPRFDVASGRVIEGHAVLQPRVTPSLPMDHEGSLFQLVVSSASGLDPYAAAVSDVYQDLFGEGSYAGKGIYDVDAFEAALSDRVADGTLLSHDLFEGIFARAGLVSDIEVVEDFPARYDVAAARQHRWARGDWQLLPWLLGRRDARGAGRQHSALPLIGFWKMSDNLRRTVSAPASLIALLAGWMLPFNAALIWTTFILATIALPTLLPVIAAILPRRAGITPRSHFRALGNDIWMAAAQMLFQVTFLPHRAWLMLDAISRTLFRLFVSHRNLLEWVTAAQASLRARSNLALTYRRMISGVGAALAAILIVYLSANDAGWLTAPFVVLWLASPAMAMWISRSTRVASPLVLADEDATALRLIARRTWRFFETFVTAEDHMLPPDNFQEDPRPVVAHRTSPTNMGLYLLSVASARDFGWIGTHDALERLEATLTTMARLRKFRGHFYNWYDTRDERPLEPHYVSSVDSGNLAAHLITAGNAAREWIDIPVTSAQSAMGVRDAQQLAAAALLIFPASLRTQSPLWRQLEELLGGIGAFMNVHRSWEGDLVAPLRELEHKTATLADIARTLAEESGDEAFTDLLFWSEAIHHSTGSWLRDITQTPEITRDLKARLLAVEDTARAMADRMEFDFLFDPQRRLLSIGYADGVLDPSCYDLLASEARLASFFAIAKGDVVSRHWFRLGRSATPIGHGAALISWSGSMFEYLMPSLVMRAPAESILAQTSRLIVRRQMSYGAKLGLPWGISESAYNARDLELTYQYSNFGVPGLGLKRGLSMDAVIAPYATALAAMVEPERAMRNFARLADLGARGRYGFYEAIDFTSSRLPEGTPFAIVRAYMAHHQGMTIVAIANVLLDGVMRKRFHAEPQVQATELLLQERTPRDVSVAHPRAEEVRTTTRVHDISQPEVRRLHTASDASPQAHLLSNGNYTVMITASGSGYSRWRGLSVSRWREDTTRDDYGSYIFLRDIDSGQVWSAGYQPCGVEPDQYEVTFTEDRATFMRSDSRIVSTLEILVSPEDDAEVRRLSITNTSSRTRNIEVTSYSELVLATPAADAAHPAFSKLFVQTEYVERNGTILATRRKRSADDADVWAAHQAFVEGEISGTPEIETDRARFLGRSREVRSPIALMDGRRLSNTVGTVLDAVFALRYRLRVPVDGTARIAFWTAVASTREQVLELLDKHHDANAFVRAGTLAWTKAQIQLRHLGITAAEANLFQRLAGHVLFADASLRASSDTICRGGGPPATLWSLGISGDLPIVLLRIDQLEDIAIARQLIQAHEYWRMKQLAVDLVILNERAASYVQDLQIALETQVRMSESQGRIMPGGVRGSVFILRTDLMPPATRAALSSVARVVFVAQRGSLAEQLDRPRKPAMTALHHVSPVELQTDSVASGPAPRDLEFFNGVGGFAGNRNEYVTLLGPRQSTPAPWINVIANPTFGFQVATEGSGFTWSMNSRENQLTPWSNDPVTDRTGEALYVRDMESGELWGPTAAPIYDPSAFHSARHGQGYSRFEHTSRGITLELLMYVPLEDPIKIARLTIRNTSIRKRQLSVTAYAEWVLGPSRATGAPFIVTEIDAATGAMFATNPWNAAFASRVAFLDLAGEQTGWTGDRREFLGRHGTLAAPAALSGTEALSKQVGAGLDPCGALQTVVRLNPGATAEVVFFLGQADDAVQAQTLIKHYRAADLDQVFRGVVDFWDDALGVVQVKTPDRSMDILLNRWALYQTLVCRMWARSAFYQASGAYGFRDQIQDGMALAVTKPQITRAHLLRAAGRQFLEGDFQHWWLPPTGQGVRTRISDDRVWLAYATAHYLATTGDAAVLEESVQFLEGQALRGAEHDAYFLPSIANERGTLFEHCARALDQSLAVGEHGLPLMGTGDWNDGMNRVGEAGRGESIWLAWFLYTTLQLFAPIARARGEDARSAAWLAHATSLRAAVEKQGWDGEWYRRGYFDDGSPLGSAASEECQIDSIAQSWSVISGAADPERAVRAMAAVDARLIQRDNALALLFTPPFDRTTLEPGYVKGYPPGLRENGGQYTHAAAWSVIAFALLGQADKAMELFSMLNPVNRTTTRANVHRYKVEPYVIAADIYSVTPHVGRGGWTWYTGSAGWMYRAGLEWILGFHLQGSRLKMTPCIPAQWPGFEMVFRYRRARYEIQVENPDSVSSGIAYAELDGQPLTGEQDVIDLVDEAATHQVRMILGRARSH